MINEPSKPEDGRKPWNTRAIFATLDRDRHLAELHCLLNQTFITVHAGRPDCYGEDLVTRAHDIATQALAVAASERERLKAEAGTELENALNRIWTNP